MEHKMKQKEGDIPEIQHESVAKWKEIQEDMKSQVIAYDSEPWQNEKLAGLKIVAGLDISYVINDAEGDATSDNTSREINSAAVACVVICSYPNMEVIHQEIEKIEVEEPYIPGFLAFRESKPLVNLLEKIMVEHPEFKPDVLLVDGNGKLHTQRCGLACHIGLKTGIPSIGVAKNIYQMESLACDKLSLREKLFHVGDFEQLKLKEDDEVLGVALITAEKVKNPVYVSIGHKISLETAIKVVLSCSKYRISEPLRFADHNSRQFIQKHLEQKD